MQVSGAITGNVIALPASFLRANGGQHVLSEIPNASLAARFQLYSRGLLPKNFGLKGSIFATLLMQIKRQSVRLQPGAGCKSDAPEVCSFVWLCFTSSFLYSAV
jgi:hypothetical protein